MNSEQLKAREVELHQEWMDYLVTSREQLDFYEWAFKKLLAATSRPLEAGTREDAEHDRDKCLRDLSEVWQAVKGDDVGAKCMRSCGATLEDVLDIHPLSQPLAAPDVTKLAEEWRNIRCNHPQDGGCCCEDVAERCADQLDAVREALQKLAGR